MELDLLVGKLHLISQSTPSLQAERIEMMFKTGVTQE